MALACPSARIPPRRAWGRASSRRWQSSSEPKLRSQRPNPERSFPYCAEAACLGRQELVQLSTESLLVILTVGLIAGCLPDRSFAGPDLDSSATSSSASWEL